MSTISSIQQVTDRYNFSIEKPTQSMDKKVLIEQSDQGLKISLKDGSGKIYQVEKWMIDGLPKRNTIPVEFFESCIIQIKSSSDTKIIRFSLPLLGGSRYDRAEMFAELGRGRGFNIISDAPLAVQRVLGRAQEYADRHRNVDGCDVHYTSGFGIGFHPEWDIELYEGRTRVWRDHGSTAGFGLCSSVIF